MAGTIFINYRREDSAGTAGRLHDRLAAAFGHKKIFMDVDRIPAGADFVAHLHQQVAACNALLVVIGPHWLEAIDDAGRRRLDQPEDFVAIEIAAALARDIPVVPVLVDNARMPKGSELPDILKPFARRQAVEVRQAHFGRDAQALVGNLREALGYGKSEQGWRRWGRRALGTAASMAVVGTLAWFGMNTLSWYRDSHAPLSRPEPVAREPAVTVEKAARTLEAETRAKVDETEKQRLAVDKAQQEREAETAAEAEAQRKAEAERQQAAALKAQQEREAKAAAEAEAQRKAEAERQQAAALKAQQEREAQAAAEAEAQRKAEAERQQAAALKAQQEREAQAAAEAEAQRKAEAERQQAAALKAQQEREAKAAAEAEASRKAEAERQQAAALKAQQEREAKVAAEAEAKAKVADRSIQGTVVQTGPKPDAIIWDILKDSNDEAALTRFIAEYPTSDFRPQAMARLAKLREPNYVLQSQRSVEDAAWDLLKDSKDRGMLQRFLVEFPNTARRGVVEQRIASLAAEAPADANDIRPTPKLDRREMARTMQRELTRIGCFSGSVDGELSVTTRDALRNFAKYASVNVPQDDVTQESLRTIHEFKGRVCPLVCPAGERTDGDHCMRITCGARQVMKDGACVAEPAPAPHKRRVTAVPQSRSHTARAAAPGHGKCFAFQGHQFCE